VRIVGGRFRGRALAAPEGRATRPTSDRARQAVFNILEHAAWSRFAGGEGLAGVRVLDLFAGSGALGFEALSRGAAWCLFVETDEAARGAIRTNVDSFGLFGVTRVHRRDATDLGPRPGGVGEGFGLVFLDPPYGQGLPERALAGLPGGGWLTQDAVAVVERGVGEGAFEAPGFEVMDARDYGAARVHFLRRSPASG
jgi:16S rRNA (guanine966-N2)-methyltransferase